MDNNELQRLFYDRQLMDFECSDQDFQHGLRLMLRNRETGELGILQVRPDGDPFENDVLLVYSYTPTETAFGTPPAECFIDDLKTRLEPEVEVGQTLSLFS